MALVTPPFLGHPSLLLSLDLILTIVTTEVVREWGEKKGKRLSQALVKAQSGWAEQLGLCTIPLEYSNSFHQIDLDLAA
jgi:hypothetical protein